MRLSYKVIIPLGVIHLLATLFSHATPHWASVITATLSFIALLCLLILSIVLGLTRWRKSSRFWAIPGLVCLAFILIGRFTPTVGRYLADRQFKKHLPEYELVVSEIRNSKQFHSTDLEMIKTSQRAYNVRAIKAARCEDGQVIVALLLDTQVPLLHEGYVYVDLKNGDACIKNSARPENNWAYIRPLTPGWYHFSDQPGL